VALADKVVNLRIFPDAEGRMNLSVLDQGGAVMVISQFTLYGDVRRGRRPSYSEAAEPQVARPRYERFLELLRARGIPVASGVFREIMEVDYVNHGPVTILVDTRKAF
jgi:D-tyrosyl-tRNA(Tyr) deacylase